MKQQLRGFCRIRPIGQRLVQGRTQQQWPRQSGQPLRKFQASTERGSDAIQWQSVQQFVNGRISGRRSVRHHGQRRPRQHEQHPQRIVRIHREQLRHQQFHHLRIFSVVQSDGPVSPQVVAQEAAHRRSAVAHDGQRGQRRRSPRLPESGIQRAAHRQHQTSPHRFSEHRRLSPVSSAGHPDRWKKGNCVVHCFSLFCPWNRCFAFSLSPK